MDAVLRDFMGWISVLPPLGGAILCAFHLGRSRWAMALTGGFALETLTVLFYRLAMIAVSGQLASYQSVGAALLFANLLGLIARTTVVVAVVGLLNELGALKGRPAPAPEPDAGTL
jgi:hypothetical protein